MTEGQTSPRLDATDLIRYLAYVHTCARGLDSPALHLSGDKLEAHIAELERENAALRATIATARGIAAELDEELGKQFGGDHWYRLKAVGIALGCGEALRGVPGEDPQK